jgi:hypothetical protein
MPVFAALGAALGASAAAATAVGAAAALSAAGTVGSLVSQRRAASQQKKSFQAEQRRAEVENIRNVRQQIRQARLVQAGMTNVAAQTGGLGGSGLAGGISSVSSQTAGNLGYMSDIARENTAISNAQIASARAMGNAQVFGTIGQLSGTIFQGMTGQSVGQAVGTQLRKRNT